MSPGRPAADALRIRSFWWPQWMPRENGCIDIRDAIGDNVAEQRLRVVAPYPGLVSFYKAEVIIRAEDRAEGMPRRRFNLDILRRIINVTR